MVRFWVGLGHRSGHNMPRSSDVKSLFEVYGRVEVGEVKLHQKGSGCYAIVGLTDCTVSCQEICKRLTGNILKGLPVLVRMFNYKKLCFRFANIGLCHLGVDCGFAHGKSELREEVRPAEECHEKEVIREPAPDVGSMLQPTPQHSLLEKSSKIEVLEKLVGNMCCQIDQLKKENIELRERIVRLEVKESNPGSETVDLLSNELNNLEVRTDAHDDGEDWLITL